MPGDGFAREVKEVSCDDFARIVRPWLCEVFKCHLLVCSGYIRVILLLSVEPPSLLPRSML